MGRLWKRNPESTEQQEILSSNEKSFLVFISVLFALFLPCMVFMWKTDPTNEPFTSLHWFSFIFLYDSSLNDANKTQYAPVKAKSLLCQFCCHIPSHFNLFLSRVKQRATIPFPQDSLTYPVSTLQRFGVHLHPHLEELLYKHLLSMLSNPKLLLYLHFPALAGNSQQKTIHSLLKAFPPTGLCNTVFIWLFLIVIIWVNNQQRQCCALRFCFYGTSKLCLEAVL